MKTGRVCTSNATGGEPPPGLTRKNKVDRYINIIQDADRTKGAPTMITNKETKP